MQQQQDKGYAASQFSCTAAAPGTPPGAGLPHRAQNLAIWLQPQLTDTHGQGPHTHKRIAATMSTSEVQSAPAVARTPSTVSRRSSASKARAGDAAPLEPGAGPVMPAFLCRGRLPRRVRPNRWLNPR